jgi:ABC-type lipoprotein export system ATPase subunit
VSVAVELRDVFSVHRTAEGDAAALQGLSLDVEQGEVLCVLGPSGAGKTTLLRVIAGLQPPSAGVARVLGEDIGRLPARARARLRHDTIGFLDQHAEAALLPDLTLEQAVGLPLALRGIEPAIRTRRVAELLDAARLSDRGTALPEQLSGGERQRVALCAALAHAPALLLADEPTGELDETAAQAVRELISELARAHGTTVIIVSHDPAAAARAERAVRIRDGRIAEDRRDGRTAVVVGRGGWIHLPSALLAEAGITSHAHVQATSGGLIVTAADGGLQAPPPAEPRPAATHPWGPAAVELRSIVRARGRGAAARLVLDGLSHAFSPGRLTAVTGRSGSGKTTLLRLLVGLDVPDAGELLLDAEPFSNGREQLAALRRRRIGYLPQEPTPVGFLSAQENVALTLLLRGWDPGPAGKRASAVLTRLGLAERARQRVARLSAGEQQRVALARALAGARGLLIVDEPTSRLDEANAGIVAGLLAAAAAADGQTVICATHDPELIRSADEILPLG